MLKIFLTCSLLLAIAAQFLLQSSQPLFGFTVYIVAMILFAVATRRPAAYNFSPPLSSAPTHPRHRRWAYVLMVNSFLANLASLRSFDAGWQSPGWILFLASLTFWITAILLIEGRPKIVIKINSGEAMALIAILFLGFFLRIYGLDSLPFGLFHDEAVNGLDARQVVTGGELPIYFPENNGRGPLFIYGVALSFRLLGESIFTLRLPAAIFGTLTLLAFYPVARMLTGPRWGLIATFLLAVSRWHINFSRIAFESVLTPLFLILTLYLLLLALKKDSRLLFGLAGITCGLGFYTYTSFRLFPLALLVFFTYLLVRERFSARIWSAIIIFGISSFLAVAPLALYAWRNSETFWSRVQMVSIFEHRDEPDLLRALAKNTFVHLAMFNYQGDGNGRHNLPKEPMLDDLNGIFFLLGTGYLLVRIRRAESVLLLSTVASMLLAGILTLDFEAPQALRTIGVIPLAYLLAAHAGRGIEESLRDKLQELSKIPAMLIFLAGASFLNLETYFVKQAQNFAVWNSFSTAETIVAKELVRLGDSHQFYVSPFYYSHPTLSFLAAGVDYYVWNDTDAMPLAQPPDSYAIFLDAEKAIVAGDAKRFYPQAQVESIHPPFGGQAVLYEILLSPSDLSSLQGLQASYFPNYFWSGEPATSRIETFLDFDWEIAFPTSDPFTVEWEGSLFVPIFGEYFLGIDSLANVELSLDQQTVFNGQGPQQTSIRLAQGIHPIRIRAVGTTGLFRLWWQTPEGEAETIPDHFLFRPTLAVRGLLVEYRANSPDGALVLERLDPQVGFYFHQTEIPTPWYGEWEGWIFIPKPGEYSFATTSIDGSVIFIDGVEVLRNSTNGYASTRLSLSQGFHKIVLQYVAETAHLQLRLYWTPPGGREETIPRDYLYPPWWNPDSS